MRGRMIDSDLQTQTFAEAVQSSLAAQAYTLRLYHTSLDPDIGTPLVAYTGAECTFDTYARLPIAGAAWTMPSQVVEGEYQSTNGPFSWTVPAVIGDTIWGLFVTNPVGNLVMAYEFPAPTLYNPGSPQFSVILQHVTWSRSILP